MLHIWRHLTEENERQKVRIKIEIKNKKKKNKEIKALNTFIFLS